MRAPDLAVIVTSFEMPWHLRRALESIAGQRTNLQLEVVVADDGSTDETVEVVKDFATEAPFPVRFVTHPHGEFHAARCRNEGVRHSSAPQLLFFDGDCLLPPDHIECHRQAWRPGVTTCSYCVRFDQAVSSQATIDAVSSGQFTGWALQPQRNKLRTMHLKSLIYNLIGHRTKPSFRSTDFFMARDEYLRINGFDENFRGWGCEDDDFGRRLRAAGVKTVSVLNRTCVYHLWHPPAPTRPHEWKRGANVAYLQRPIRLTRCVHGVAPRRPQELTVRLAGIASDSVAMRRVLAAHGWIIELAPQVQTDVELLCRPGSGRFSGRSDCRILAILDDQFERIDTSQAQVVLSVRGTAGQPGQVRLRLDDADGLWAALQGRELLFYRAAA